LKSNITIRIVRLAVILLVLLVLELIERPSYEHVYFDCYVRQTPCLFEHYLVFEIQLSIVVFSTAFKRCKPRFLFKCTCCEAAINRVGICDLCKFTSWLKCENGLLWLGEGVEKSVCN